MRVVENRGWASKPLFEPVPAGSMDNTNGRLLIPWNTRLRAWQSPFGRIAPNILAVFLLQVLSTIPLKPVRDIS